MGQRPEKRTEKRRRDPPGSPAAVRFAGAPPKDLFAGGGEMGALMRSTDWSKTKLGPVDAWPRSLRTMLGAVLGSRFPMLLWWGPDLLHLYNDAYRPILRDKHPASLAAPAAQVWAEVWDVAGPMARSVLEGGPATWTEDLQLFINSGGMAEETYFTFSYSPVPGDDGRVGGLLNTVQETTVKVQGERQIRMLHDLAARASEAKSEGEAYRIAAAVLSANELDLPFALLYALNDEAGDARLVGVSGWTDYDGPAKAARVALSGEGDATRWPLAEVSRTAREVVVDGLSALFGPLPAGRANARPERAIVLPLLRAGLSAPYGFLVAGISPHRALDERYRRFFAATADQVMTVIANARAYEAERKRAEALAEIDRTKTTFFSNVSHEFRTPLTLILSPVEDALAQPTPSLDGQDLQAVHRSALRLLRLVNSLLDFARLEAGRLQTSFTPTDLSTLTAGLASSFRSMVERSALRLVVDCPPLTEAVYVDVSLWEKIVLNLVSNAFKFTLQGEIAVTLRWCSDHIELTVQDTGCGIPERELPRMFERFHRVEGARGRSFEGTGIGLSLVQEFTRIHGGTVRVSSVEGQGSRFVVSIPTGSAHLPPEMIGNQKPDDLPMTSAAYVLEAMAWSGYEDEGAVPEPPPGPRDSAASANGEAVSREGARVLIADDNADMRNYLAKIVRIRWEAELAADGQAALEAAREHPPDLVLSDVMMPRMDGLALLRQLRADPRTREVPVVLLSARAGEESLLAGIETGADDYLIKPFSARELIARIQTHLNMGRLRREWGTELEAANRELEAFSRSVSHDLRSPLLAVQGFSSLLAREYGGQMPARAQKLLHGIETSAVRMGQLIEDLLEFSRLGRQPLSKRRVSVATLVHEVLEELGIAQADHTEVRVGDLADVVADASLLKQVFSNLLSNAFKFTRRTDRPKIEIGCRQQDGETVFFVQDNGAGFDMQDAARLFGVFQRLHSDEQFAGTGVGLSLMQRIVQRHSGRIWADAAVGRGATFLFMLPSEGGAPGDPVQGPDTRDETKSGIAPPAPAGERSRSGAGNQIPS
jgi:signal transduction histidine kinase